MLITCFCDSTWATIVAQLVLVITLHRLNYGASLLFMELVLRKTASSWVSLKTVHSTNLRGIGFQHTLSTREKLTMSVGNSCLSTLLRTN